MMPVADARVQAEIKSASRLRWFMPQQTLGYVSAETGADGYFTIELSDSLLSQTALNCFVANVNITAPTAKHAAAKPNSPPASLST